MLLRLAVVRGWTVTPSQRVLLAAMDDAERLEHWCERVLTCSSFDEVLAG
jgi:hypothetical protein